MNEGKIKVPRLKPGQGAKGPSPVGCYNTGLEPVIYRSRSRPDAYLVGPHLVVLDNAGAILGSGKRVWRDKYKREVRVYWTRTGAVRQFRKLAEAQYRENARDIAEIKRLRAQARKGDAKAALSLSDYGLI